MQIGDTSVCAKLPFVNTKNLFIVTHYACLVTVVQCIIFDMYLHNPTQQ